MRMRTLLPSLVKVILATVVMTYLGVFLERATASYQSWILTRAVYMAAIFGVSIVSGVMFPGDRWMVRPAATISLLCYYGEMLLVFVEMSRNIPGASVSSLFRPWIAPFVCMFGIAYLFSPFFHDGGRIIKSYFQSRITRRKPGSSI